MARLVEERASLPWPQLTLTACRAFVAVCLACVFAAQPYNNDPSCCDSDRMRTLPKLLPGVSPKEAAQKQLPQHSPPHHSRLKIGCLPCARALNTSCTSADCIGKRTHADEFSARHQSCPAPTSVHKQTNAAIT